MTLLDPASAASCSAGIPCQAFRECLPCSEIVCPQGFTSLSLISQAAKVLDALKVTFRMTSLTQAQLREELSKALQDAKSMFNEGLVDENEYGDLKSHELKKYKTAVAALSSAPPAPAPEPPSQQVPPPRSIPLPRTPPRQVVRMDRNPTLKRPAPVISTALPRHQKPRPSSPARRPEEPVQEKEQVPDEAISLPEKVSVDPDMYERLRTPPIFRRKGAALRRRVVVNGTDSDIHKQSLSFE